MTTLKEYKAMMEGATDAPWSYNDGSGSEDYVYCNDEVGSAVACVAGKHFNLSLILKEEDRKKNGYFIAASRNIAPEIIRVIELAESALETCGVNRHGQEYHDWDKIKQALYEIRKLKGE